MNLSIGREIWSEAGVEQRRRRAALRMVDRQLSKGNFKLALSLIKHLPSLRGFAAATQIPRRASSVDQLHLTVTEASSLQSLLDSINTTLEKSSSVTGEDNDLYIEDDTIEHRQVMQHEAGHFLVGYLLGVLPKQYTFSVMEDKTANANVKFVGFEFLTELEDVVLSNNLHGVKRSNQVVRKFACVILGGLVAEHLAFGYSKGHHGDVDKLEKVLKWLLFTKDEARILRRWAVLNTLTILRRQSKTISTLAEAMLHKKSVGNCIDVIETNLNH